MNTQDDSFDYVSARSAEDVVRWAIDRFHPRIALACSFSLEDIALIHMMRAVRNDARVFAIDTGRLNEETYKCAEAVRVRLGVEIEWYFPRLEDVEKLEREKGLYSFMESLEARHECCRIRKVEPLSRALAGLSAWITGLRREQSVTRAELKVARRDDDHGGIVKVNPLADWDWDRVRSYVTLHNLPYNRLYDEGYASIGCEPCTRAIRPGEHPRAGRWWWESPEHKECGLHVSKAKSRNSDGGQLRE